MPNSYASYAYLGYVAGIIDGEGWIVLQSGLVRIGVKMTDLDVLERCQKVTGVGTISGPIEQEDRKPQWTWTVSKQADVAGLLMTIYPLMSQRRQTRISYVLQRWRERPLYHFSGSPCGTHSGFAKHYRRGEKPCFPCREAKALYDHQHRSPQGQT